MSPRLYPEPQALTYPELRPLSINFTPPTHTQCSDPLSQELNLVPQPTPRPLPPETPPFNKSGASSLAPNPTPLQELIPRLPYSAPPEKKGICRTAAMGRWVGVSMQHGGAAVIGNGKGEGGTSEKSSRWSNHLPAARGATIS